MKRTKSKKTLNGEVPKPEMTFELLGRKGGPEGVLSPPVLGGDVGEQYGRVATEVKRGTVTYLVKPWIPFGCLTMIAGQPQTGKSSFAAFLVQQAQCAAILPGYEESVGTATIPRLEANGALLAGVLMLDDKPYRFPRDKKLIVKTMKEWGAILLVIDPIDSYMEDGKSENAGPDVREMLESFAWIADQTEAAVVGIRHPGKEVRNIMPGSRQWRAVPRSIVCLSMDASFPPRRFIVHDKDSHGNDARPCRYLLEGVSGKPRRFVLGASVDAAVVTLSREVMDPTSRREVRKAGRYCRRLFETSPEPLVSDWKEECTKNGVSDRDRRDASRLLELDEKPGSVGGKWIMVFTLKEWPSWTDPSQKDL
jgi:hypothetical protein